jgi:hypothetical protein
MDFWERRFAVMTVAGFVGLVSVLTWMWFT